MATTGYELVKESIFKEANEVSERLGKEPSNPKLLGAWFYGRTEMPDPAGEKTCSPVSLLSDYRYFKRCRCKKAFRAFQLSDQDRSRSKIYRYRNCKG